MWERIKAFIKSIIEYFVPKKTTKQIEQKLCKKLKILAAKSKYKKNIQDLILQTVENNKERLISELSPDDKMIGLFHCIIWFETNVPEVFDQGTDFVHKELNNMYSQGRLIRVPNVALNKPAMGWITSYQKYEKQKYGKRIDLESLHAQDYLKYIIKNAKRGVK